MFSFESSVVADIQHYPVLCLSSAKSMEELKRLLLLILGCAVQVTHTHTHSLSQEMCLFSFACLSTSLDCGQRQGAGWDRVWVGLQDLNKLVGDLLQESVVSIIS